MSKTTKNNRIAIIDGLRTPFCKAGTDLAHLEADQLGALCVKELMQRSKVEESHIDEVIIGNVSQPVKAANVARVIALKAGLSSHIPAYTVHRNCASGLQSITNACSSILANQAQTVIAGGTESMSNIPFVYSKELKFVLESFMTAKTTAQKLGALRLFKFKYLKPIIGLQEGLTDPVCGLIMGLTAENLAREFKIDRHEQDLYALESHKRVTAAIEHNRYDDEIMAISDKRGKKMITADNGVRLNQTIESLEKLKPFFDRKNGTVTVGNSSQVTDGAAAMILMSESRAKELKLTPMGYIRHYSYAGLEPDRMGLGPVYAMSKCFETSDISFSDIDLFEINEAFAAQVLACHKAADSTEFAKTYLNKSKKVGTLDPKKCNVNGGAIAQGHPVGTSGTRIVLTLLHELKRQNKTLGCASLCVGGGQGGAIIIERH